MKISDEGEPFEPAKVPDFYDSYTQKTVGGASGARITPGGKYRTSLWRYWDSEKSKVFWVMLNPSTADALSDDPTIRKCIKFAKTWGYGGICVVNLFAYRATDPKELKRVGEDVALGRGPRNTCVSDDALEVLWDARNRGDLIVAAWGQGGKFFKRDAEVLLRFTAIPFHALKLSKDGTPWHPLYLKDDSVPFLLEAK